MLLLLTLFALHPVFSDQDATAAVARTSEGYAIPPAPEVPEGEPSPELVAALDALVVGFEAGDLTPEQVEGVAQHGDPRVGWIFLDVLRFGRTGEVSDALVAGFEAATGVELPVEGWIAGWKTAIDFLMAWDTPAMPGYVGRKARIYTALEPAWTPLFADEEATLDWRLVTWGGVFIDDRPLGETDGCPRGCIPALDDPRVTDAAGGGWYGDDEPVFGVSIGGEWRAYPKHQMETHEMVLDTLGGRRFAMPYCTLCASAQVFLVDRMPAGVEMPVLRTSGLLSRSNKVMYDLRTGSLFNTFTGEAVSGPLRERGVRLPQVSVVTTSWGEWKAAHPETTILREDGGIGRQYERNPLGGRDDDGPIFPVGGVDPRLAVQERVVGVLFDGEAIAFHAEEALAALARGDRVARGGVSLARRGGGLTAVDGAGEPVPSHSAFWFAWSQFYPSTALWRDAEAAEGGG
ncbi:MAG: DUF3179 domain-containing (seleno)protein [Planctomycetota bacterium]